MSEATPRWPDCPLAGETWAVEPIDGPARNCYIPGVGDRRIVGPEQCERCPVPDMWRLVEYIRGTGLCEVEVADMKAVMVGKACIQSLVDHAAKAVEAAKEERR